MGVGEAAPGNEVGGVPDGETAGVALDGALDDGYLLGAGVAVRRGRGDRGASVTWTDPTPASSGVGVGSR